MQRLPSVQCATRGTAAAGRVRLVAAIELDRWVDGRAWIYTCPAPAPPMYGMSAHPQRVDIVSAQVGVTLRPGPNERLLIESPSAGDLAATDAEHPGRVLIEDIATWARKYPIGAKGWLRRSHRDDVPAAAWVLSHCIARLLCGRGLSGSAVVQIGSPPLPGGEPGLPPDAALCQVGRRTLVVDLSEGRVIEIDPAIANVLNGGTDCVGSHAKRMD